MPSITQEPKQCNYKSVNRTSHTEKERVSMYSHRPHATSQPYHCSHTRTTSLTNTTINTAEDNCKKQSGLNDTEPNATALSLVPGAWSVSCADWRSFVLIVGVPRLLLHGKSSKRLAPPRNIKDRKHLQSTQSTVNSQTKHQALSKGQPGRRMTPINTAAVHALSTATTRHHHPHPTGSSPDPRSQRSPLRSPAAIQAGWLSKRGG